MRKCLAVDGQLRAWQLSVDVVRSANHGVLITGWPCASPAFQQRDIPQTPHISALDLLSQLLEAERAMKIMCWG